MEIQCSLALSVFSLIGCVSANASGHASITRSTACGFEVQYLENSSGFCFVINQEHVDHLFCLSLKHYSAGGCLSYRSSNVIQWGSIGKWFCSGKITRTAEKVNISMKGRKLMHHLVASPPSPNVLNTHDHQYFSYTKPVIASTVVFLLCCVLTCQCFRQRRKDISDQVVQPKELITRAKSDRVLGSPHSVLAPSHGVPASPLRGQNSSLQAQHSPTLLSMSPRLSRARSLHLTISQIIKITNNFAPSCMIGEGSFGNVYKAQLPNGQLVAIKRARKRNYAALQNEFNSEVDMLARIGHRNLVRLLDCIDKGNERIIITEYVSNGTLREHLEGRHGRILDFSQRLEISIDVAHALAYLHLYAERAIIHRDVKSSNILLTESFRAKVTGFGFAKTGSEDADKTHVSTKVRGTLGYVDPVYLHTSKLTPKSDVFSFGILLIEILSERWPIEAKRTRDEKVTVRWAYKNYTEGKMSDVLDPRLEETVDEEVTEKMLNLAFQCVAPCRDDRPMMKEAAERLWDIRKSYRILRMV